MSIFDLCCDHCGAQLMGPAEDEAVEGPYGIRFLYHPGNFLLKDDSGLLCTACWAGVRARLGEDRPEGRCAMCGQAVEHAHSLHLHRAGDPIGWQLCKEHAVEFLNGLRTVEPKLDPATFSLSGDWTAGR
jgi:hypothetical protein